MAESTKATFLQTLTRPTEQLRFLRIPVTALAALAVIAYPWAMMGAIMASDSGTSDAMRVSYLSLFGFTFYVVAVVLAAIKWTEWPLVSAILLIPVALANIAAIFFSPFVAARIALLPLGFLGIHLPELTYTIVGSVVFGLLFIVAPVLSISLLFRHANDVDSADTDPPATRWDLKRLNTR